MSADFGSNFGTTYRKLLPSRNPSATLSTQKITPKLAYADANVYAVMLAPAPAGEDYAANAGSAEHALPPQTPNARRHGGFRQALFTAAGLPTTVALSKKDTLKLLAAMKVDKKVIGGQVKFVLAKSIGQVAFGIDVPKATIKASLQ